MFLLIFVNVGRLKQTQTAECCAVYCDTDHTCSVHSHLYVPSNGKTFGSNHHTSWNKKHICMQILFYLICPETFCVAHSTLRKIFITPTYFTNILCLHCQQKDPLQPFKMFSFISVTIIYFCDDKVLITLITEMLNLLLTVNTCQKRLFWDSD